MSIWGRDYEAAEAGRLYIDSLFDTVAMDDEEFFDALDSVSDEDYVKLAEPLDRIAATLYDIHYGPHAKPMTVIRRGPRVGEDARWTALRTEDPILAAALETWATEHSIEVEEGEAIRFYFDALKILNPEVDSREEILADDYLGAIWEQDRSYSEAMRTVCSDLLNKKDWR
jgi:hypothetical protein